MKNKKPELRKIQYFEKEEHLKWMRKNLGNHQMSAFVREAVREKIARGGGSFPQFP